MISIFSHLTGCQLIYHCWRTTSALRYFPKDYVREFMAESVSFLLRNAPNNQLAQGTFLFSLCSFAEVYTKQANIEWQILKILMYGWINAQIHVSLLGLMKLLLEAAKKSSPVRTDGVISLLWHVMKGTSTKLHSRAGKVLKFLLSKLTFTTIHDKFPNGKITFYQWHVLLWFSCTSVALPLIACLHCPTSLCVMV